MTHLEQTEQKNMAEGNTNIQPKKGRRWCFTLNNWTQTEFDSILLGLINTKYIIGKEIGGGGTPHLQGYIEYPNPISFQGLKTLLLRSHIEKAKGNKKANYIYCSKEGNFVTNITGIVIPKVVRDPLAGLTMKTWQQEILDIVATEPDERSIYWYWEEDGGVGKTSLCKHLCLKHDCLIVSGKQNDMFNSIIQWKTIKGDYPSIIIVDIPRSNIDYLSWGGIEKIKDGLFYSGKYEGGMVVMNCPHLICLANSLPDESKLSADRWQIKQIE